MSTNRLNKNPSHNRTAVRTRSMNEFRPRPGTGRQMLPNLGSLTSRKKLVVSFERNAGKQVLLRHGPEYPVAFLRVPPAIIPTDMKLKLSKARHLSSLKMSVQTKLNKRKNLNGSASNLMHSEKFSKSYVAVSPGVINVCAARKRGWGRARQEGSQTFRQAGGSFSRARNTSIISTSSLTSKAADEMIIQSFALTELYEIKVGKDTAKFSLVFFSRKEDEEAPKNFSEPNGCWTEIPDFDELHFKFATAEEGKAFLTSLLDHLQQMEDYIHSLVVARKETNEASFSEKDSEEMHRILVDLCGMIYGPKSKQMKEAASALCAYIITKGDVHEEASFWKEFANNDKEDDHTNTSGFLEDYRKDL